MRAEMDHIISFRGRLRIFRGGLNSRMQQLTYQLIIKSIMINGEVQQHTIDFRYGFCMDA